MEITDPTEILKKTESHAPQGLHFETMVIALTSTLTSILLQRRRRDQLGSNGSGKRQLCERGGAMDGNGGGNCGRVYRL